MKNFDVFFISYDEPQADLTWERFLRQVPWAKRVHGIKGFDAAHKACARESNSSRFFTVDGDNEIRPSFLELNIDSMDLPEEAVLSWSARNSINGLSYGNGGIKNWPKKVVAEMKTHENSKTQKEAVDFCFQLKYLQMPETLSDAMIHGSAFQAFRAGFREGVKMCLERGQRPPLLAEERAPALLRDHVWQENLNRLKIWCSVGADVENGPWAMYGARLGCKMLTLSSWNYQVIRDYDWFDFFWRERCFAEWNESRLKQALGELEIELNHRLDLEIATLSAPASRFFKSVYHNPPRKGFIFP